MLRAGADESEARLSCGLVNQLVADPRWPAAGAVDACGDPLAVGAELLRLLGQLDARGPLLVIVENVHWADTLQVTFALRRLRIDPVLAVFTARDGETLPEGLRRLVAERGGRKQDVGFGPGTRSGNGTVVSTSAAVNAGAPTYEG